uniref:Uncharacterized protein n=1 Tax=Meloidogyne enterolobii TaxID=390850 RepID=A0A6V7Y2W4_MELEN|nr:unnamed protein product [Meloidogyne enterolobii]
MSNTFFVYLPSNVPDYPDNKPNKFRVHLPKPLYFSGDWVCGLHSISYPYSWPSTIGTLDEQWIDIHFTRNDGQASVIRVPIPRGSHTSTEELLQFIIATLQHQSNTLESSPLDLPETLVEKPKVRRPKRKLSPEGELKSLPRLSPENELKSLPLLSSDEEELKNLPLLSSDEEELKTFSEKEKETPVKQPIQPPPQPPEPTQPPPPKTKSSTPPPKPSPHPPQPTPQPPKPTPQPPQELPQPPKPTPQPPKPTPQPYPQPSPQLPQPPKPIPQPPPQPSPQIPQPPKPTLQLPNPTPQPSPQLPQPPKPTPQLQKPTPQPSPQLEQPLKPTSQPPKPTTQLPQQPSPQLQQPPKPIPQPAPETTTQPPKPTTPQPPKPTTPQPPKPTTPQPPKPTQQAPKPIPHPPQTTKPPTPQSPKPPTPQPPRPAPPQPPKPAPQRSKPSPQLTTQSPTQPSLPTPLPLTQNEEELRSLSPSSTEGQSSPSSPTLPKLPEPEASFKDPLWTEEMEHVLTKILGKTPTRQARINYLPNMPALLRQYGRLKKDKIDPSVQKQIIDAIEIFYHVDFERFKVKFNHPKIKYLSFSNQLGYVLGFENPDMVRNNEVAKYGCDLRGGFSSFAVYSKGLTENMIIGNSLSSLLRVVSVAGATPGEYYEKIYDSPIYARVLPKEVNEIEIELRTMDNGRLVPFEFGTVLLVLIFKKVINF